MSRQSSPFSVALGVADLLRLRPQRHREGTPLAAALDDHTHLVTRSAGVHDRRDVVRARAPECPRSPRSGRPCAGRHGRPGRRRSRCRPRRRPRRRRRWRSPGTRAATSLPFSSTGIARLTASTGTAKPTPEFWSLPPLVRIWELTPITRPWSSSSGPPELPGLIAASVCTAPEIEKPFGAWIVRPSADTMPLVTVPSSPNGLPIAIAGSPGWRSSEAPSSSGRQRLADVLGVDLQQRQVGATGRSRAASPRSGRRSRRSARGTGRRPRPHGRW